MKKNKAVCLSIALAIAMSASLAVPVIAQNPKYPETRKSDQVDTYFGNEVPDPYRWLEDDNSPETKAWVAEENKTTFDYFDKIPYRAKLKERLTQRSNYARY